MEIYELNNRATALINAGRLDEGEAVLDQVGRVLKERGPAKPDGLQALCDEYFYVCHRSDLAWRRSAWQTGLSFATRALELEDLLWAVGKADHAYSVGSWAAISLLTRCGQFEPAEKVFAKVLDDAARFAARLRCRRENAEHALLAGLCLFFEAGGPAWLERGKAPIALAQKRLPFPKNLELTYGYACFHARVGDERLALLWLERSIIGGVKRERAREDEDFSWLRQNEKFLRLTGEPQPLPTREPKPPVPVPQPQIDEAEWEEDRRRREQDSVTAPQPDAIEKTRIFLGEWRKATIVLRRGTTYGLGALELTIHGSGKVAAVHDGFGTAKGHKAKGKISEEAAQALFEAFVREAFSELFVGHHCGVPDELYLTLTLEGARRGAVRTGKFVRTEHRRFDALAKQVREAAALAFDDRDREKLTL